MWGRFDGEWGPSGLVTGYTAAAARGFRMVWGFSTNSVLGRVNCSAEQGVCQLVFGGRQPVYKYRFTVALFELFKLLPACQETSLMRKIPSQLFHREGFSPLLKPFQQLLGTSVRI